MAGTSMSQGESDEKREDANLPCACFSFVVFESSFPFVRATAHNCREWAAGNMQSWVDHGSV